MGLHYQIKILQNFQNKIANKYSKYKAIIQILDFYQQAKVSFNCVYISIICKVILLKIKRQKPSTEIS